jgi:hypothetical protein
MLANNLEIELRRWSVWSSGAGGHRISQFSWGGMQIAVLFVQHYRT